MANVTIEEMSIVELKAALFDQIAISERTQRNVKALQDEMKKKIIESQRIEADEVIKPIVDEETVSDD